MSTIIPSHFNPDKIPNIKLNDIEWFTPIYNECLGKVLHNVHTFEKFLELIDKEDLDPITNAIKVFNNGCWQIEREKIGYILMMTHLLLLIRKRYSTIPEKYPEYLIYFSKEIFIEWLVVTTNINDPIIDIVLPQTKFIITDYCDYLLLSDYLNAKQFSTLPCIVSKELLREDLTMNGSYIGFIYHAMYTNNCASDLYRLLSTCKYLASFLPTFTYKSTREKLRKAFKSGCVHCTNNFFENYNESNNYNDDLQFVINSLIEKHDENINLLNDIKLENTERNTLKKKYIQNLIFENMNIRNLKNANCVWTIEKYNRQEYEEYKYSHKYYYEKPDLISWCIIKKIIEKLTNQDNLDELDFASLNMITEIIELRFKSEMEKWSNKLKEECKRVDKISKKIKYLKVIDENTIPISYIEFVDIVEIFNNSLFNQKFYSKMSNMVKNFYIENLESKQNKRTICKLQISYDNLLSDNYSCEEKWYSIKNNTKLHDFNLIFSISKHKEFYKIPLVDIRSVLEKYGEQAIPLLNETIFYKMNLYSKK